MWVWDVELGIKTAATVGLLTSAPAQHRFGELIDKMSLRSWYIYIFFCFISLSIDSTLPQKSVFFHKHISKLWTDQSYTVVTSCCFHSLCRAKHVLSPALCFMHRREIDIDLIISPSESRQISVFGKMLSYLKKIRPLHRFKTNLSISQNRQCPLWYFSSLHYSRTLWILHKYQILVGYECRYWKLYAANNVAYIDMFSGNLWKSPSKTMSSVFQSHIPGVLGI